MTPLVPVELIASNRYLIRNVKVMLDRDLAVSSPLSTGQAGN